MLIRFVRGEARDCRFFEKGSVACSVRDDAAGRMVRGSYYAGVEAFDNSQREIGAKAALWTDKHSERAIDSATVKDVRELLASFFGT